MDNALGEAALAPSVFAMSLRARRLATDEQKLTPVEGSSSPSCRLRAGRSSRTRLPSSGRARGRHPHQSALRRRGGEGHPGQFPRGPADCRDRARSSSSSSCASCARRPTPAGRPARAAVVVPNGTLFGDGVCARIKEELLKEFNLHTIVRLPNGVFAPTRASPPTCSSSTAPAPRATSGTTSTRCPKAGRTTPRRRRSSSRSSPPCQAWWDPARGERARLDGAGRRAARQQLQPRPQEPARQGGHRPPAARANRRQHPRRRSSASRRSWATSRSSSPAARS